MPENTTVYARRSPHSDQYRFLVLIYVQAVRLLSSTSLRNDWAVSRGRSLYGI